MDTPVVNTERKSCGCCWMCTIVCVLVIIGGLNWGLIGLGYFLGRDLNVVHMLLETWPIVEAIVYIVVGIAAIAKIFSKHCPCRKGGGACCTQEV